MYFFDEIQKLWTCVYLLLKSMKYTFKLMKNQTGKSWYFSKYPGMHPGPKSSPDPGI